MSKISTIFDTLLTTIAALYPSKTRIPNPYIIDDNSNQFLRDGYGLRISPETPSDSEFCRFSRTRTFGIVLTKEVITTDSQTSQLDTASKALLEDVYTIQKDFMNYDQIGINDSIEKIDMLGTSAIEFYKGEFIDIISIEVLFNIQVTDDI